MQVGREFGELLARDDMSPPGRWNFIFTASNQRDANGTRRVARRPGGINETGGGRRVSGAIGGSSGATEKRITLVPATLGRGIVGGAELCTKIGILIIVTSVDVMPHPHNLTRWGLRMTTTTALAALPFTQEENEDEEQQD